MRMTTITFDAIAFLDRLKNSGFNEAQAKAVIYCFHQVDLGAVATKGDLNELRMACKNDLSELKADLFKWFVPLMLGQVGLIVGLMKLI